MHWKPYMESQGKPPTHEVKIRHDARDAAHPFLLSRVQLYEGQGKKVILQPIDTEKKTDARKVHLS